MISTLIRLVKAFTKQERMLFFGGVVIFSVATLFTVGQALYHRTVAVPTVGGEYTEGIVGQPIALNPLIGGANEVDRDMMTLLFADLMTLVEKHEVSTDGKVWTLTIKPDLKWSDGAPLNADDVVFTLETIQAPETASPLASSWQGVTVERISQQAVKLTTRTPYAFFLDTLKNLRVAPRHIFEAIPPQNLRLSSYNLEPISSGPYQFVSYEKQKDGFISRYELTSNSYYAAGHALIPKFNVVFFRNYKDALVAFNQKIIDGLGGFDPANLSDLRITHQIIDVNIPRYYALFLNPSANAALKEVEVRAALDLATDRKTILEKAFNNRALAVSGPILSYIDGYNPDSYQRTLLEDQTVESLLEKSGWKLNDQKVYEKKPTKTTTLTLEFELSVPDIAFLKTTAELIQAAWAEHNIKLTLNVVPPQELNSSIIKTRNYQMVLFGNILRANPDIFSFWHSTQRFAPGLNLAMYENAAADRLLESVRREFDTTKRAEMLAKLQTEIHSDYPAIFLFSPVYLYAAPKDLGGFEEVFIPTPSHRFEHVSTWYLETTRVFK